MNLVSLFKQIFGEVGDVVWQITIIPVAGIVLPQKH